MLVLKSSEKEQRACAEFLKWFTSDEQNIAFSTASGYLPVTKSANNLDKVTEVTKVEQSVKKVLRTSFEIIADNQMYTSIPFKNGTTARAFLEKGMRDLVKQDREIVEQNLESGMTLQEAVSQFDNDDYFHKWYEDTKIQLELLVQQ